MNYWLAGYPPGDRLEPWIYLSNSSFWGRVTVCCGDLCFFANFGQFSVIFGQKLAVFIIFDKEEDVRFCSELLYALVAPIPDMSWKCPVLVLVSQFFGQNPYFPGHRFGPNNR